MAKPVVPLVQPERWRDLYRFVAIVLGLILLRSCIADWHHVPSNSMFPTIHGGDRVLVNRLAFGLHMPLTNQFIVRWNQPKRGDIVTFHLASDPTLLIKRVAAVPGDLVFMRSGWLVINGEPATYRGVDEGKVPGFEPARHQHLVMIEERILNQTRFIARFHRSEPVASQNLEEEFQRESTKDLAKDFGPLTVTTDHYLVLGDHRDDSVDYRSFGLVHRQYIQDRAYAVAISLRPDTYTLQFKRSMLQLQPSPRL